MAESTQPTAGLPGIGAAIQAGLERVVEKAMGQGGDGADGGMGDGESWGDEGLGAGAGGLENERAEESGGMLGGKLRNRAEESRSCYVSA